MAQGGERRQGPIPGERKIGDSIVVDRPLEQSVLDYPRAVLSWIEHLQGFAGSLINRRPAEIDPNIRQADIVGRLFAIREASERQFVDWLKKQWEQVNQAIEGLPFDHKDMWGNPWRVTVARGSVVSEGEHSPDVGVSCNNRDKSMVITFGFDKDDRLKLDSVRVYVIDTTPHWSDSGPRGFLEQRGEDLYSVKLGGPDGRVEISWQKDQRGSFSFPLPVAEPVPAAS